VMVLVLGLVDLTTLLITASRLGRRNNAKMKQVGT